MGMVMAGVLVVLGTILATFIFGYGMGAYICRKRPDRDWPPE